MADEGPKGVAVVQPGDTLVIGFDRNLSDAEWTAVRSGLGEYLPEGVKVAMIEGASCMVVVKGSDGE